MNRVIFYTKKKEDVLETWAKLIGKNNDISLDVRLDNNADYGSISDWKNHNLEFHDTYSEFSNELYHYYFMPIIYKYLRFQKTHNIYQIDFIGKHPDFYLVAGYFLEKKIKINGLKSFKLKTHTLPLIRALLYLITHIISIGTIVFKAIKTIKSPTYKSNTINDFALIHSKSSFNNIESLKLKLTYFYDDINIKQPPNNEAISFYQTFSFIEYLKLIPRSFFLTHHLLKKIRTTGKFMIGDFGTIRALSFFSVRIGHFILIKEAYKNIFKKHPKVEFYSGEKESSYGILAMNYSKEYQNFAIAIPHGMSYSYKYPLGLFGQKYYSTSKQESIYLNQTYNEAKFIYNENINKIIYQVNEIDKETNRVVFFTEPRRQSVNFLIIKNLTRMLNQTLYIKLHPLEKKSDYQHLTNIKFITNFDKAIQSNICVSRKSTILIQAPYNNSKSIAFLVDEQDKFDFFNFFPSLSDSSINKCYSYDTLIDLIQNIKITNNKHEI